MCIAPEAVMGMPICNTFIHSGLVPFHIHAVIPEERLHDLTSNPPSFCFLFVLLFDTTPRSLSRQTIGSRQGSQPACLRLTGIIGVPPPPGSLAAALIAWSPAKGAVTGRKYHCPLSMSLRCTPPQGAFSGLYSLDTIFCGFSGYQRPPWLSSRVPFALAGLGLPLVTAGRECSV